MAEQREMTKAQEHYRRQVMTLAQKKTILAGQGTRDIEARLRALWSDEIPAAEGALERCQSVLRDSRVQLGMEMHRLEVGAEGKTVKDRELAVASAKCVDKAYKAQIGAVDLAEINVSEAEGALGALKREYGALIHILDLRAAQLHFLSAEVVL